MLLSRLYPHSLRFLTVLVVPGNDERHGGLGIGHWVTPMHTGFASASLFQVVACGTGARYLWPGSTALPGLKHTPELTFFIIQYEQRAARPVDM